MQSLYVEREGAFVLDVEGAVEKSMLEEARGSNAAVTTVATKKGLRPTAIPDITARAKVKKFQNIFPFAPATDTFCLPRHSYRRRVHLYR